SRRARRRPRRPAPGYLSGGSPPSPWPAASSGSRVGLHGGDLRLGQEAGSPVPAPQVRERGLLLEAALEGDGAAGVEPAAPGGMRGVGDVPAHRRVGPPPLDRG